MKMQLGVVSLISLLPFWPGVLGSRIPEINGSLGGLSAPGTVTQQKVSESVKRTLGRTPGKLRGVVENSGVCGWLVPSLLYNSTFIPFLFLETTPGVYQASGYGDLTKTESIW